MLSTMQGLVEYAMYVSQDGISIYGGNDVYQWKCACSLILPHGMIKN